MSIEFPSAQVTALQQLGAQLHEQRKSGGDLRALARQLLQGFFDLSTRHGLDRTLDELAAAHGLDTSDRAAFAEHPAVAAALVAQLETINLDGGGPRNAKPRQVGECVIAALTLTVVDEPDRSIALDDTVRAAVAAALTSVVEVALAAPALRTAIITEARQRCDETALGAFDKIAEQLDDHGLRLVRQPKVPISAMQSVQQALFETRNAIVARAAADAIDRAQAVIAAADPAAAARIDQPITARATPREVAILRVQEPRVEKTTPHVVRSILESLTELARLGWRAPVRPVLPYAASKTFAVGDLIEHPKFGLGTVTGGLAQRIDVEFADGNHTLVHVAPRR